MGVPLRASKRLQAVAEKSAKVVSKKGAPSQARKQNLVRAKNIVVAEARRRHSSGRNETAPPKKITKENSSSKSKNQPHSKQGTVAKRTTKGKTPVKPRAPRLTKKVLSAFEEETMGIRPVDRGSSWDGNSDTLGSVNSGVLDENLCFLCGIATTEDEYDQIVLCDTCDGEYHLSCVGLTSLPRISWTCTLCREERARYSKLRFEIPNYKASELQSVLITDILFSCLFSDPKEITEG
jgi:hypothetical protein